MSTSIQPQFFDSTDIFSQNLKNNQLNMQLSTERQMLGNLPGLTRQRNCSGSSTSALSTASSGSGKICPPCTLNLISFGDSAFTTPRGKLDRSMSEPGRQANINSSRYKTELCRPFEESGFCKYADKCQFAHGMQELRNLSRHPKYKTEPCRTFHTTAYCPYGSRCHFIHNEEERNMPEPPKYTPATLHHSISTHSHFSKVSMPGPVQRPKTFDLSLSSLTSPSESSSSSGSTSPTVFVDELTNFISSPALSTATTTTTNSFNLTYNQTLASLIAPLNVQTSHVNLDSFMNNQHNLNNTYRQELKNYVNQRNNTATTSFGQLDSPVGCDFFSTTPSPPESVSGDSLGSSGSGFDYEPRGVPIDLTKGLRLPVFSQLSLEDKC